MKPSTKSRTKARTTATTRQELRLTLVAERGSACQACHLTPVGANPPRPFEDLHEVLTRGRGGDPTDPANILLVDRICHKFITEHETDARALGLVRARTAEEHTSLYRPWEKPATATPPN